MVVPTVENFYWILFDNLLKPLQINCHYYYPWGTKNILVKFAFFSPYRWRHMFHVLFHFDQEPIWSNDLGLMYETWEDTQTVKFLRILANSEHSSFKKQVIREHQMLDWYFFYHGFAALDWFKDTKYINTDQKFNRAFLSLNHLVSGQRAYRLDLTARLIEQEVHHNGTISMHATKNDILAECGNEWSKLNDNAKDRIAKTLLSKIDLPLIVDDNLINGNLSAHCGPQEYQMWQSSLWHIVNETVFYEPKLHLTEKIFKPIVSKRPFILVAAPKNLAYLRSYGFETFGQWIDEGYDQIDDDNQRLEAITNEITKFNSSSSTMISRKVLKKCCLLYSNTGCISRCMS